MARVALVTGGTRGIGAEISRALKEAGRTVVATYLGNDKAAEAFSNETGIKVYKFDVCSFDDCKEGSAKDCGGSGPYRDPGKQRWDYPRWNATEDGPRHVGCGHRYKPGFVLQPLQSSHFKICARGSLVES